MIEHTHLHQILQNQIFPKWWWCVVEDIITKNEIWWPRSTGGPDRPGPTYIKAVSDVEFKTQLFEMALYMVEAVMYPLSGLYRPTLCILSPLCSIRPFKQLVCN